MGQIEPLVQWTTSAHLDSQHPETRPRYTRSPRPKEQGTWQHPCARYPRSQWSTSGYYSGPNSSSISAYKQRPQSRSDHVLARGFCWGAARWLFPGRPRSVAYQIVAFSVGKLRRSTHAPARIDQVHTSGYSWV